MAAAFGPVHAGQAALRTACLDGRKILSISLGEAWSAAWVGPGWINQTTEVPADLPGLKALGLSLATFLANHADYVVDTAKVVFTQDRFGTLLSNLTSPEDALAAAKTAAEAARDGRLVEDTALRADTRGLIALLATKLGPDDPRWDSFGLNRPGASVTPGQPAAPALSKGSATTVHATVAGVSGAAYYRWFTQLTGVDTEFRFAGRTLDPATDLPGQPATGSLKVKVQAANEAGPGVSSPVATLVLG